jgi:hypothetical protein
VHVPSAERDVIQQILLLRKPGDVLSWWNSGPGEDIQHWTHPLSEWERKYAEAMSAETVPEPIRMWPLVTPERLTSEQREAMVRLLGTGAAAAEGYICGVRHTLFGPWPAPPVAPHRQRSGSRGHPDHRP